MRFDRCCCCLGPLLLLSTIFVVSAEVFEPSYPVNGLGKYPRLPPDFDPGVLIDRASICGDCARSKTLLEIQTEVVASVESEVERLGYMRHPEDGRFAPGTSHLAQVFPGGDPLVCPEDLHPAPRHEIEPQGPIENEEFPPLPLDVAPMPGSPPPVAPPAPPLPVPPDAPQVPLPMEKKVVPPDWFGRPS